MKKLWLTVLILLSSLCLCFGLAACDLFGGGSNTSDNNSSGSFSNGSGDSDMHTHVFEDYVYNNDATCTEDGTETAHCSCGATGLTRTKTNSKLGHNFET